MRPGVGDRPGRQRLAEGRGVRVRQRDGVLRAPVRPRRGPVPPRAPDHQPPQLARPSGRDQGGHGHRPRDVLPGQGRLLRGADRGGGRRHGRRPAGHHPLPVGQSCSWRTRTDDGRRVAAAPPDRRSPARGSTGRWSSAGSSRPRAQELFFEGLVRGTTHLGVGQEAVAAGFAAAMRDDDYTFATYRGHNHALARGAPMGPLYAELFGRASGLMGGKGGSMHITDVGHHMMGSYAIVGAHLPIAARRGVVRPVPQVGPGRGLLLRRRDDEHRRVPRGAQPGGGLEGAGRVRLREQPVHGVHADRRRSRPCARPAADRAAAYGLEPIVVDGNDVEAVYEIARRVIDRARAGEGPSLVEAVTYRHGGHSRADPGKYRPGRRGRGVDGPRPDPARSGRGLVAAGVDEADARQRSTRSRGRRSPRPRRSRGPAPEPAPAVIETQVWADGGLLAD